MNQKARCVEDNKAANPGQEQHDTDNQKHLFSPCASGDSDVGGSGSVIQSLKIEQ
jgi:hypothetical protein